MSLGISKLFKVSLLFVFISLFYSCSYKIKKTYEPKKEENKIIKQVDKTKKIEKKISIKDKENKHIILKKELIKTKINIKEKAIQRDTKKIKSIKKELKEKINTQKKPNIRKSTKLTKSHLDQFKFDFIKKGKQDDNTLFIIGGIQGDEPGGFMAASLLSTHYTITKGSLWIVPNLNFYSIIKRARGPFGDMNRKFANLSKKDPDYKTIQRIKKYITNKDVKLIVNLHDGSGFYRPMYIDKNHRPKKWGQTVVIDQDVLHNVKQYSDTYFLSQKIIKHLNKNLLKKEDYFRTKNTHTRFKKTSEEKDMSKTLTYFAVKNGKSAFAHETSKSLKIPQRVYYKLLAIEKFMDIMGIEYKRKFKMNVKDIKKALNHDISIKFDDTDIKVPLKDIRNIQKYFPIDKSGVIRYLPSNPLIKIIKFDNVYTIYYGNRRLTKLQADYAEHINFKTEINFVVDGKNKQYKFGDTINIKNKFLVKANKKFRVNVIGYKNKKGLETDVNIYKKQFIKRYSIEKKSSLYRVEFYKGKKFAGMILVKYK